MINGKKVLVFVGPDGRKWDIVPEKINPAKAKIVDVLFWESDNPRNYSDIIVASGGCHLGGTDIFVEEIADKLGIEKMIIRPDILGWNDKIVDNPWEVKGWIDAPKEEYHTTAVPILGKKRLRGYKTRNIELAVIGDVIYSVAPTLPFHNWCKHCKTNTHPSNGGCWTMQYAKNKFNKETHLLVI